MPHLIRVCSENRSGPHLAKEDTEVQRSTSSVQAPHVVGSRGGVTPRAAGSAALLLHPHMSPPAPCGGAVGTQLWQPDSLEQPQAGISLGSAVCTAPAFSWACFLEPRAQESGINVYQETQIHQNDFFAKSDLAGSLLNGTTTGAPHSRDGWAGPGARRRGCDPPTSHLIPCVPLSEATRERAGKPHLLRNKYCQALHFIFKPPCEERLVIPHFIAPDRRREVHSLAVVESGSAPNFFSFCGLHWSVGRSSHRDHAQGEPVGRMA